MGITKKQTLAMAAIVVAGVLGAGAVLTTSATPPQQDEHGHAETESQAGHEDHGGEGERGHDDETPAGGQAGEGHVKSVDHDDDHADANGHSEAHGHTETEPHAEPRTPVADVPTDVHDDEERKVALSEQQRKAATIDVQTAGAARLQTSSQFQGEIRFNEDRTAHVVPRLAGVVESVPANLGQRMQKGQVLAVISSTALADQRSELLTAQKRAELARSTYEREKKLWEDKISAKQDYLQARSALQEAEIAVQNALQKLAAVGADSSSKGLSRLEIRAPFNGIVVEKHVALGEAVKEDANIFTLSDLSTVWAEFVVSPKDLANVRVGQKAVVSSTAFASKAAGSVSYVGSLLGEQTRTAKARVTLSNPDLSWRPGLFVTVSVAGGDSDVPVAVNAQALQTLDNQTVVFTAVPGGFVAKPVKVGRSDGKTVEVLEGIQAGDAYAASNTFVLKSELGKSSATHAH